MSRIAAVGALVGALALGACSETQLPTEATNLTSGTTADAMQSAGPAGVYVVHGINGTDLGLPASLPVDVSVDGACVLTGFEFRSIAGPVPLATGTYAVAVSVANPASPCSEPPVIAADVPVDGDAGTTIVAHLTPGGTPTASVFTNPSAGSDALVVARHTAAFGAVDVVLERPSGASATLEDLVNGMQASVATRPGRAGAAITPANADVRVFETSAVLNPFTTYIFYAVGTPGNGTFEVIAQRLDRRPGRR